MSTIPVVWKNWPFPIAFTASTKLLTYLKLDRLVEKLLLDKWRNCCSFVCIIRIVWRNGIVPLLALDFGEVSFSWATFLSLFSTNPKLMTKKYMYKKREGWSIESPCKPLKVRSHFLKGKYGAESQPFDELIWKK